MAKDSNTVRTHYLHKERSDILNSSTCHTWCYVTSQHSF